MTGQAKGRTMAKTVTIPAWLTPGADVVLYGGRGQQTKRSTVKTVGTMLFTVDDPHEPRFRIDRCVIDRCVAVSRNSWEGLRYVVPLDSDTAREELARAQRLALHNRARRAVELWTWNPSSSETFEAAITALQAVVDEAALLTDGGTS